MPDPSPEQKTVGLEPLPPPGIFYPDVSRKIREAAINGIPLCLTLSQYRISQKQEAVAAILHTKNPGDLAGELGGRIGILSTQPHEQIIRSYLELINTHPDIVVGVRIYDPRLDQEARVFIKRAEDTLKAAVVVGGGKVAVSGRLFAPRKFTVEERERIIPPGQVEKIISAHK